MRKLIIILINIFLIPIKLIRKISIYTYFDNVFLGKKIIIKSHSRVHNSRINDNSIIGRNTIIINSNIGKYCSISDNVYIGLQNHPIKCISSSVYLYKDIFKNYESSKLTTIGDDVWIGYNASIKCGINIGKGAIIGAGSVVTKDVPEYAIVGGVPAKLIKYRFSSQIIEKIKNIDLCNLSKNELVLLQKQIEEVEN